MNQGKSFFTHEGVSFRYEITPQTNVKLFTLIFDRGYKSLQHFADELGVSRPAVSHILHRHEKPGLGLALKIAKLLKTDSRVIFYDSELKEKGYNDEVTE